ncbi:hypothetical protein AG1IA_07519 [Rhizoctonia solani AG-1 IA]|uniref:Uncharacterized protein n=1 Tax=Thanatephorus cucumeris (strain AG1-IA) TaxID=983506 RepID=L8WQ36_THACA|nr:hypothetical protein AG1IA_07519 [Rhizoctonia solani AG-1 IA]
MRPRVPSCKGALTVTISHWATNSLISSTRRAPTALAASSGRGVEELGSRY